MAATYEVPLRGRPQNIKTQVGSTALQLRTRWDMAPEGGWVMDILDGQGNELACGVPLTPGVDLLDGLGYLGIGPGAVLYCYSDGVAWERPTFFGLGTTSHLVFQLPGG